MLTIELHGRITHAGTLEVDDLPAGLPPGEVNVTIQVAKLMEAKPEWTEDELREALTFQGLTGTEIGHMLAAGELDTSAWVAMNITDPVAWLEEQRRLEEQRERRE